MREKNTIKDNKNDELRPSILRLESAKEIAREEHLKNNPAKGSEMNAYLVTQTEILADMRIRQELMCDYATTLEKLMRRLADNKSEKEFLLKQIDDLKVSNQQIHSELKVITQKLVDGKSTVSNVTTKLNQLYVELEVQKKMLQEAKMKNNNYISQMNSLEIQINKKENYIEFNKKEQRDLFYILENLFILVRKISFDFDDIMKSWRWVVGNHLIRFVEKLLLRPNVPLASDHMIKLFDQIKEYEQTVQFDFENYQVLSNSYRIDSIDNQVGGVIVKKDHEKIGEKQVKLAQKGQNTKREVYFPLPDEQLHKRINEYKELHVTKKVVLYTAIMGNYDVLKVPETLTREYDYVCFTDMPIQDHPVWKFQPVTYFNAETTRIARYYKLHPHFYFEEYDVAVWVDANILIRKDINYLIDNFLEGDKELGIFTHYQRDCTYREAATCINREKDEKDIIEGQMKRYQLDGFPEHAGLPETNILISKPNDLKTQAVLNYWWKELDNGSKRDQLSVMYALWKNGTNYTPIVDSVSKMARFDRENYELFEHQFSTSQNNPSVYHVPLFLQKQYSQAKKQWWELLNPLPVTDSMLWKFRKKNVDIVISIHNALDDVKKCISSVEPTLLDTHNLILVDDGSDEETKAFLEDYVSKRISYVTLIRHDVAKGYTKAANAGLRASEGDFVILLNSDTIVPPLWILKIIHCADNAKEIGIVGPMSNAASWQSIPKIKDEDGSYSVNPLPEGVTIQDVDMMCQKSCLPEFPRVQLVNGFCLCIKRAVIDRIGLLDEDSYPKGYNEENDYCFRATDAGFDLAIATNTYVYHAKSKSYTPEKRLLLCEESRVVFEKTYGVHRINRATESVRNNPLINKVRSVIEKGFAHV